VLFSAERPIRSRALGTPTWTAVVPEMSPNHRSRASTTVGCCRLVGRRGEGERARVGRNGVPFGPGRRGGRREQDDEQKGDAGHLHGRIRLVDGPCAPDGMPPLARVNGGSTPCVRDIAALGLQEAMKGCPPRHGGRGTRDGRGLPWASVRSALANAVLLSTMDPRLPGARRRTTAGLWYATDSTSRRIVRFVSRPGWWMDGIRRARRHHHLRVSQWAHLVGLALGTLRSTRIGNAPPGQ